MRVVFVALTLGILAAASLSSPAGACGRQRPHSGCGESAETRAARIIQAASERLAEAKKTAEEMIGRARREVDEMKAVAAREIVGLRAAAERDVAEAARHNSEAETLRHGAVELQEFLVAKTEEQRAALVDAIKREHAAEERIKEADDAIRTANARDKRAKDEIELTLGQRHKHDERFHELLDKDPCGPTAGKAPRGGA